MSETDGKRRYRPRMNDADRLKRGRELRRKYERGTTIRALADEAGLSYWQTRQLLLDAGTTLRGRGARIRTTAPRV